MTTPGTLQRAWAPFAQSAAWLTGVLSTFVVAPPRLWVDATTGYKIGAFTQVALAIIAGAIFWLGAVKKGQSSRVWITVAALGFLCGTVLFFLYEYSMAEWTCQYSNTAIVRGRDYLPPAQEYLASHPGMTCAGLVMDHAGETNQIWPERQILNRHVLISVCFMALTISFSVGIMSLIQAIQTASSSDPRQAAPLNGPTR